jgi:hypothetical protein
VKKEARRHRRVPWMGPVRLSWEDARGEVRFAQVKCIDVSESGMRIECPVPVAPGSRILLNAERIHISGAATVKHVARFGGKYILGVALAAPAGEKTSALMQTRVFSE